MTYELRDLIEIPRIQSLIDSFEAATGIPAAVVTNAGEVLIKVGWQDICLDFHRKNPRAEKKCIESATRIRERLRRGGRFAIYRCPNGLIDAAAPIVVDGEHVANVMTGQFLFHNPDSQEIEFFKRQAETYGFDRVDYLKALSQVPVISEEQAERSLEFLSRLAELLAELGLARLRQIETTGVLERAHQQLERRVYEATGELRLTNAKLEKEVSIRKQTEEALQRTKTELETIIDSVPALITYKDREARYIRVNQSYADLGHLPREAIEGKTTLENVPDRELAEAILRDDQEVIASGVSKRDIIEPLAFDQARTVKIDKVPYRDEKGEVVGVIGIATEITAQLAAQRALKESEERYRSVVEGSIQGIVIVRDELILYANPAMAKMFGYDSTEELAGKNVFETLIAPDERARIRERGATLRGGHSIPIDPGWKGIRKDGSEIWIQSTANLISWQGETACLAVWLDVTEWRRAEEALRESEVRYRSLVEGAIQGIAIVQDECIQFANQAVANMFGYGSPHELVGKSVLETLVAPEERKKVRERAAVVLRGEPIPIHPAWRGIRRDGSEILFQSTACLTSWQGQPAILSSWVDVTELRKAEEALRESEQRWKILFEYAPDAYYLTDLGGRLLDVNRAAAGSSGYTKEELVGKKLEEIGFVPSDGLRKAVVRSNEGAPVEATGPEEYTIHRKDGTRLFVAMRTYPVKIKDETLILGIGRDITEQKQEREEAASRIKRLREQDAAVLELATHTAIVKGDLEISAETITEISANVMDVERAGVWLLSDDRQELHCLDLFERQSRKHVKGKILRAADYPCYFKAFESSRTIDAHDACSDSRTVEFREAYLEPNGITSMLDAAIRVSGALVGVVCHEQVGSARTWHDDEIVFAGNLADQVAEAIQNHRRVQADEALRESESRYRTLVENIPVAVYRTTPGSRGRFLMANPMFLKMFGLRSEQELVRISAADLYNDPSQRKAFSEKLMTEGIVEDAEFHLRKKGGCPFWGSVTARVQHSENGQDVYFDCTIVDITARKRTEEEKQKLETQLQHAQKMEAIGTLAGGIAHNFNNLLMAIQGNASLMMLATNHGHPHFGMLKSIEKSVESGSRLTNQLLGYAREGRYEVRSVNLNRLVKETVDTFGTTRKDIRVHLDLVRDLEGIEADHVQIEQVLLNLIVNAADAMPTGGAIFIRTENVTERDMQNKPYRPKQGSYALLTVRDTGVGMDPGTMERIFDPFFTTKGLSKGTGLGLASVYGIVKAHGGYIDVDSVKGQGSTFSIYLPASVRTGSSALSVNEGAINGSETILLVDDEEVILDVGMRVLEALGYRVLGARGGSEALEIYQTNRDRIDLVILDMAMPDMAGGETYDRMKKIDQNVRVLLSSGYSIDGQASEILARGCDGFIQKPFNMDDLSTRVREVLEQSP